jgi:hypothetical protein
VLVTGDEKSYMKSVKVLGFQVKILMVLVKELFDRLGESPRELYSLLLLVHRLVNPYSGTLCEKLPSCDVVF